MIGLEKSRGGRTNRRVSLQKSCFPVMSDTAQRSALYNIVLQLSYNKQLIAQLVGRHKDLSHQENSCLPRAT